MTVVDVTKADGYRFTTDSNISARSFLAEVAWKLTAGLAGTGKSVRIASATVGCTPIDVCDDGRAMSYYLLEGEPLYVQTKIYDSSFTDVCVSDLSYNGDEAELVAHNYYVPCNLNIETVKHLKVKLSKMTCRQPNSLHVFFKRKELGDEQMLSDCVVDSSTKLECMSISSRRRQFYGTPYINITPVKDELHNLQQIVHRLGAADSVCPAWRRALPGLWLEGVCTNHICPAYSCMVIVNQGFTNLDFFKDKTVCKCPICYKTIVPLLCGFSKCKWKTVGKLKDVTEKVSNERLVEEDWKVVSENEQYMTIFPDCNLWSSFKVCAKELQETMFCVVCMRNITSEALTAKCGHSYHKSCLGRVNLTCLQCFGKKIMRDGQLDLFT